MQKLKGYRIAQTNSGSCTIDMRFMLRYKKIKRNGVSAGFLEWTQGERVYYESVVNDREKYLRLKYTYGDKPYDYTIHITEIPSNLGKGTILYFLCPESGKRSRFLISAYGEPKFINREYYEQKHGLRIYYGCQKTSKMDYHNTRYFDIKRKVDDLQSELLQKHCNSHYRGKPTTRQMYLLKLKAQMQYHDNKRIQELYNKLN